MKKKRKNRQQWIQARTSVAEQLLRACAAAPNSSIEDLRKCVDASDLLFSAALQHLVGKDRISWPQKAATIATENLLAHLAANGGCSSDKETLRSVLNICDEKQIEKVLYSLVEDNRVVVASDRVFLPPNDACLNASIEEISSPKFSIYDVANTSAVIHYANRSGISAQEVAPIVAQALELRSRIVNVGQGEFRSYRTVQMAVQGIRAAFQEYRECDSNKLLVSAQTDDLTFKYVLKDLQRNGKLRKAGNTAFKPTGSLSARGWPCSECGTRTKSIDFFFDKPLCMKCRLSLADYRCITKTRALQEYRLREHELYRLRFKEHPNPHFRRSSPMQLFLLSQVQDLAKAKWGSDEPYLISLTEVSEDQWRWFEEDPERLKKLSPEQFEYFVANCFEKMGLCVQLIGRTNKPDGGIDLIAYPDPNSDQPKYLLAVQVEHHSTDRKTGVPKVQRFAGAASAVSAFRLGFVVTNTSFTWNAEIFAKSMDHFLRLRSLEDLLRWFRNDFNNEAEWREIPDFIEIGGFQIPVLKPKLPLFLPDGS